MLDAGDMGPSQGLWPKVHSAHTDTDMWARSCIGEWQQNSGGILSTCAISPKRVCHTRNYKWPSSLKWSLQLSRWVLRSKHRALCKYAAKSETSGPSGLRPHFQEKSFLLHLSNDVLRAEACRVFYFSSFGYIIIYFSALLNTEGILDHQAFFRLCLLQKCLWCGGYKVWICQGLSLRPNLELPVTEWGTSICQKHQNGNVSLGIHTLSQLLLLLFFYYNEDRSLHFLLK